MSTLTTKVAAIEIKILYLHYRAVKILKDQESLHLTLKNCTDNQEKLKQSKAAVFNNVDIIIMMEHISGLIRNIFSATELKGTLSQDLRELLKNSLKVTAKWEKVRNSIGGHLNMETVEAICNKYNFKGVFISEDIDRDASILNMLFLQEAVNKARKFRDIFGRDIDFFKHDAELFGNVITNDFKTALEFLEPMIKVLYEVGMNEKLVNTSPSTWKGLVID